MSSESSSEDPVSRLFKEALFHQLWNNSNPYVTYETLVHRILKRILHLAGLSEMSPWNTAADTFYEWHSEIRTAYELVKKRFSIEEQNAVERVLAKDAPHSAELVKFANGWMKHDPKTTCRWFAVDGTLGSHPKFYVQEAFASEFQQHAIAVRTLYTWLDTPEQIKAVVQEAFERCMEEDPVLSEHAQIYVEKAGKEMVLRMSQLKQQPKKTAAKRPKKEEEETF